MVINSTVWVEQLPKTIWAAFYLKGSNPVGEAVVNAHQAHMDYLQAYGLTDLHVPLVELDLSHLTAPGPFKLVRNGKLKGTKYMA